MQASRPSFCLSPPPAPAWDSNQCSLFAANGVPMSSSAADDALRKRVANLLATAHVPAAHRTVCAAHLCKDAPLDPALALWLGAPGRAQRWASLWNAFAADDLMAARVRAQARRLLDYAQATRCWPRSARSALRLQRNASGAFDHAWLPPVPPRLRALRHVLLPIVMATRAQLYEALALPVRETRNGAVRSVEVLGSFRLHFDFERRNIHVEERGDSGWIAAPENNADLVEPLPTAAWCTRFVQNLRQPLRVALGAAWDDREMAQAAFGWIATVAQELAVRSRLLDRVREQIRDAYPCDRQVIHDVRACLIDLRARQGLSVRTYVWAWRNAAILRRRVGESPQLAAAWGLALRLGLLDARDDYDRLRDLLRERGITPAGWQLLRRYGRLLYRPLIGPQRNLRAEFADLCRYLRLLQRAQSRAPMPYPLVQALFAPHWFAAELDPAELPLGLIRGAIERVNGELPLGGLDAFIEHEFVPVISWLARARPALDAHQQRAPWTWYIARYRQWSEFERQQRKAQRWSHGLDGLRWRRFDIVPIRDSATLWSDGEQMRMCLSCYASACAAGQYLVYAVRAGGRQRPIAHIGLRIGANGAVTLDQVRGFANARVEPALEEFATRLAGMHSGTAMHVPT